MQPGAGSKTAPFVVEPLEWNLYWSKSAGNDPASQWMRETLMGVVRDVL